MSAGQSCKLYINGGTRATPSLTEVVEVRDLTNPNDKTKVNLSTRESKFNLYGGGQKENGINFDLISKPSTEADTNRDTLEDSYDNDTVVDLWALDGASTDTDVRGFRAPCVVFKFDKEEPLDGEQKISVEAAPTRHEESGSLVEPDFYVVP